MSSKPKLEKSIQTLEELGKKATELRQKYEYKGISKELDSFLDNISVTSDSVSNYFNNLKEHQKKRPISTLNPPYRDPVASIGFDDKAVYKHYQELDRLLGVEK